MDIELLNKAMRAEARSLGLCDEWYGQWADDSDIDELLNKYVRGIDFVIGKHFPEDKVLVKYAGKEKLHEHGIYVDDEMELTLTSSGTVVVGSHCTGTVTVGGFAVANIYLRDDADIRVIVTDSAKAFVETYDQSKVYMTNRSDSRCFVYHHGGHVETRGNIIVREKRNGLDKKQI